MKNILSKVFSALLTVFIIIQFVLCLILMIRSVGGGDNSVFGYRFYCIVSPSMEPEIQVGAHIIVKETEPELLKVGDIITFNSDDPAIQGFPNTHRIAEIKTDGAGNLYFVTKGDNNEEEDDYPVYPKDIYGKVVVISPAMKGLVMFYSFVATPIGFTVVVILPLLVVFGIFMRSFIKTVRWSDEGEPCIEDEGFVYDEELISAVVKTYLSDNPEKELSPEETEAIAKGLAKNLVEKGADKKDG